MTLYIDELNKINACLVQGWMDANIHAMIIFILCPLIGLPINYKTNFGYRHNRHFSIIDKVASKGIIHKNKAANQKSKISKHLNNIK